MRAGQMRQTICCSSGIPGNRRRAPPCFFVYEPPPLDMGIVVVFPVDRPSWTSFLGSMLADSGHGAARHCHTKRRRSSSAKPFVFI